MQQGKRPTVLEPTQPFYSMGLMRFLFGSKADGELSIYFLLAPRLILRGLILPLSRMPSLRIRGNLFVYPKFAKTGLCNELR